VRRAHDERLLRSSLAWSGKAPARLSAKNCRCSSTSAPAFLNLNGSRPWNDNEVVIPENYTATDWIYLTICAGYGGKSAHPLHLHGHDFAILQVGKKFCKDLRPGDINLRRINPARRDVVLVPSGGFVIIAFKADNPGN